MVKCICHAALCGNHIDGFLFPAIKFTDIAPIDDRRIVVYLEASPNPPDAGRTIAPALIQTVEEAKDKLKVPGALIYVYVAVQDSGPGLKPGDLALLFQRFQQGKYAGFAKFQPFLRSICFKVQTLTRYSEEAD